MDSGKKTKTSQGDKQVHNLEKMVVVEHEEEVRGTELREIPQLIEESLQKKSGSRLEYSQMHKRYREEVLIPCENVLHVEW